MMKRQRLESGEVRQELVEQPAAEGGSQQQCSTDGFPQADGRWHCPFCDTHVGSKAYLAQHVRRDHEGLPGCQGEEMVKYLCGMSRWLCGGCFRTSSCRASLCGSCGESKDSKIPG